MGYLDTKQKIIETLTGRVAGTQIQPSEHQEFALSLLEYIRSVELISGSTLVGVAQRTTVPVQPDTANTCYVGACSVGDSITFENFHGEDGEALTYTADANTGAIILLTWNKQYWEMTAVPSNISVTASAINYVTTLRKTYTSVANMNADTNPMGDDGQPILVGQLVSVYNSASSAENGIYSRTDDGWRIQGNTATQIVQSTGTGTNVAMSQGAVTDELQKITSSVELINDKSYGSTKDIDVSFSSRGEKSVFTGLNIKKGDAFKFKVSSSDINWTRLSLFQSPWYGTPNYDNLENGKEYSVIATADIDHLDLYLVSAESYVGNINVSLNILGKVNALETKTDLINETISDINTDIEENIKSDIKTNESQIASIKTEIDGVEKEGVSSGHSSNFYGNIITDLNIGKGTKFKVTISSNGSGWTRVILCYNNDSNNRLLDTYSTQYDGVEREYIAPADITSLGLWINSEDNLTLKVVVDNLSDEIKGIHQDIDTNTENIDFLKFNSRIDELSSVVSFEESSSDVRKLAINDLIIKAGEKFSLGLFSDDNVSGQRFIVLANTYSDNTTNRIFDTNSKKIGKYYEITAGLDITSLYLWSVQKTVTADVTVSCGGSAFDLDSKIKDVSVELSDLSKDVSTIDDSLKETINRAESMYLLNGLVKFTPVEVKKYDDIIIGIPAGSVVLNITKSVYINYAETGSREYPFGPSDCPYVVPIDVTSLRVLDNGTFNIEFSIVAAKGSVNTESLQSRAVTIDKTEFGYSKNLINLDVLKTGTYIDINTGSAISYKGNATYTSTPLIELEVGKQYKCNKGMRFLWYFDEAGYCTRGGSSYGSDTIIELNEGERYIAFTVYTSYTSDLQLEEGTESTPYQPYSLQINPKYIDLSSITARVDNLEANIVGYENTINVDETSGTRPLLADNLSIKEGDLFTLHLEGTAKASRYIVLANTSSDRVAFRVLDSPSYGKTYQITAKEDINKLYIWAVSGFSEYGTITVNISAGFNAELEEIRQEINDIQQNVNFTNEIAIPDTLYMLSKMTNSEGKIISQNDIFYKEIMKRWMPYDSYITVSGMTFDKKWSNVASVIEPVEGQSLWVTLRNYKTMQTIASKGSRVHVGEPGVGSDDIYIMVMGDSTVNGACHRGLYSYGFVPNCHCVGLRKTAVGQYDEGRGGWRLSGYHSISTSASSSYNPYYQPDGDFVYLGATGFWINAWLCYRGTQPSGFEPNYSCGRYGDFVSLFDETTGYFKNPEEGYLMYDNSVDKFKLFTNGAWVDTTEGEYTWKPSFKYLSVFNIHIPDYFVMSLGLNDFRTNIPSESTLTQWNAWVEEFISAFKEINPNGFFILSTCTVSTGKMDNVGDDTNYQHAAMWVSKKNICDNFSGREDDGVYIVDTALMVDADNAFTNVDTPIGHPLNTAITATQNIQSGNPHFYNGYNAWAIPLAAFIQYTRTDK